MKWKDIREFMNIYKLVIPSLSENKNEAEQFSNFHGSTGEKLSLSLTHTILNDEVEQQ